MITDKRATRPVGHSECISHAGKGSTALPATCDDVATKTAGYDVLGTVGANCVLLQKSDCGLESVKIRPGQLPGDDVGGLWARER